MGFRFRKSLNFGPLRINLGKSGVGYSVGGKGIRTGVRSNGKSYTTYSIPGTGISYTKEGKKPADPDANGPHENKSPTSTGRGCLLVMLFGFGIFTISAVYTVIRFA